jgi:hypothetical protein
MRSRFALAALAVLSLPPLAAPAQVRLGVGGDYIFDNQGAFELTLAVEGRLARHIAVEGRFGGLVTTSSPTLGVPLDFGLRVTPGGRAYLEALIGPWFFFNSGDAVRGHAAFGFGLEQRQFSFGLELGVLTGANAMLGARLAWRI